MHVNYNRNVVILVLIDAFQSAQPDAPYEVLSIHSQTVV